MSYCSMLTNTNRLRRCGGRHALVDVFVILKPLGLLVDLTNLSLARLGCEGRPEVGQGCHGSWIGLDGHHGIPAVRVNALLAGKALLSLKMRVLGVLRDARNVLLLEGRGSAREVAAWHGVM